MVTMSMKPTQVVMLVWHLLILSWRPCQHLKVLLDSKMKSLQSPPKSTCRSSMNFPGEWIFFLRFILHPNRFKWLHCEGNRVRSWDGKWAVSYTASPLLFWSHCLSSSISSWLSSTCQLTVLEQMKNWTILVASAIRLRIWFFPFYFSSICCCASLPLGNYFYINLISDFNKWQLVF